MLKTNPHQTITSPEIEAFSYEGAPGYEAERYKQLDDFATWAAEALHGSMRSTFRFSYENGDMVSRDGRRLHDVFRNSLESADELAEQQPQLRFELRRRIHEYEEYEDMLRMAEGHSANTMVVVSDFPPELMTAERDIGGYNVDRKTAFLRVIAREPNGEISITSQTLDRSDRAGLEEIYADFDLTPQAGELLGQRIYTDTPQEDQGLLIDRLTGIYDRQLQRSYGGEWYAGRRNEKKQNTYDFVMSQTDLLDVFVQAKLRNTETAEVIRGDIIAAIDARYQKRHEMGRKGTGTVLRDSDEAVSAYVSSHELLMNEIQTASRLAAGDNKTYSGCGITVSPEQEAEDPFDALGYRPASAEDKYGSLKFTCQKGHVNTRPRNKLIDKCKICGTNVKC